VFAVSKKRVSTVKCCYKKTSAVDDPANCYEPESHGDATFTDSD
jgi:hypothetical protein